MLAVAATTACASGSHSPTAEDASASSDLSPLNSTLSSDFSDIVSRRSSVSSDGRYIVDAHLPETGPYGQLDDETLFELGAKICVALHGTGLPSAAPASGPSLTEVFDKATVQPPGTQAQQDAMVRAAKVLCP